MSVYNSSKQVFPDSESPKEVLLEDFSFRAQGRSTVCIPRVSGIVCEVSKSSPKLGLDPLPSNPTPGNPKPSIVHPRHRNRLPSNIPNYIPTIKDHNPKP